jgi:hypothetical protein
VFFAFYPIPTLDFSTFGIKQSELLFDSLQAVEHNDVLAFVGRFQPLEHILDDIRVKNDMAFGLGTGLDALLGYRFGCLDSNNHG